MKFRKFAILCGSLCFILYQNCSRGFDVKSENTNQAVPEIIPTSLASCTLKGQKIDHGQSINAFQLRVAPAGTTCTSEVRSCNNGLLSGSLPYPSCIASNQMAGYNIVIRGTALNNSNLVRAVDQLQTRLEEMNSLSTKLSGRQGQVSIFITDSQWQSGAMTYHPSAQWLSDNNMDVAMAKNIELVRINDFLAWNVTGDQPMMVLHEFVHAYHDQVLGFSNSAILSAYAAAKSSGKYNSVRYHDLNGPLYPAYGMNNDKEYFSEISEAYFGTNDYFPFNRSQLQSFDTDGYNLMLQFWTP